MKKEELKRDPKRKRRPKAEYRRYRRYSVFFFCGWLCALCGAIFEFCFFSAPAAQLGTPVLGDFFLSVFGIDAVNFLLLFFFGVTVYAPFFHFALSLIRGFSTAFTLQSLIFSLGEKGSVSTLILFSLYSVLSAILLFAYSSFCTIVSLRIFTDGITWSLKREENRVFGGTLFNSTLFCNTINLRFLFSYTLFFLASLCTSASFTLVYTFLLTRFR